jgi:serine/threonine protein kinase
MTRRIGGFVLDKIIGRGPRAEVWSARGEDGRNVALKVVSRDVSSRPAFVAVFEKETASLLSLRHSNIVSTLDRGCDAAEYYVVQEHQRESLRHLLRQAPLNASRAVRITAGVCEALDHAHRRALVHRHLVAENIFVDAFDVPRVGDFGWSLINGPPAAEAAGSAQDDLYKLARLLYELLSGKPAAGEVASFDERTDAFFRRALSPDPRTRFSRASEMGLAMALLQKQEPIRTKEQKEASKPTVAVETKGTFAMVKLEAGATASEVEPALQLLVKTLAKGGRLRIGYDLTNLTSIDHTLKDAIIRWHERNRAVLSHVAFCSPRSAIRASTLLMGRANAGVSSRVFATAEPMRAWIEQGGDA